MGKHRIFLSTFPFIEIRVHDVQIPGA